MTRLLLLIIATVLVVLWIWLAKKYEAEFKDLTDSIDPNEYRYPELFCVGFGIMKILHIDSRSKKARTSFQIIYTLCISQSSYNLWTRINAFYF